MARSFVKANPDFLNYGAAVVTATPLSLVARIKLASLPPNTAVPFIAVSLGRTDRNDRFWIDVHRDAGGIYYANANAANAGVEANRAYAGFTPSTGVWYTIVGVFASDSSQEIYWNGLASTTGPGGTITPAGLDDTRIGGFIYSGGNYGNFDGDIADVAIYNAALTAGEAAQYDAGVSPLLIRPGSLVGYWPLFGRGTNEEDWVGGHTMTTTGATVAEGPRLIGRRASVFVDLAPPPPSTDAQVAATEGADTASITADATRSPATYYIDNAGSDSNSGLSGNPWQTATAVNAFDFIPGDKLIFTAGQTFAGPFTFNDSGTSGAYIVITTTGRSTTVPTLPSGGVAQSSPATITIADGAGNGINVVDAEYIWLDNIHVQGSGVNTTTGASTSEAIGLNFKSTQTTNKLRGVRVTACSVTGCRDGLLAWGVSGKGWDALQIWGCKMYANQEWAFMTPIVYNFETRPGTNPAIAGTTFSNDIYIGYCEAADHPGNGTRQGGGIYPYNCTGGVVEYSVAHDIMTARPSTSAAGSPGIALVACDGVTIRFCEAYNIFTNSTHYDGEAFNFDAGCVNCVIEYSFGHDCDGGGFMGVGGTLRYNVFANNLKDAACVTADGVVRAEITHALGTPEVCGPIVAYGNTIYATGGDCYGITKTSGSTNTTVTLVNNILVSKAARKCVDAYKFGGLYGNVYYALGGGTTTVSVVTPAATYTSLSALHTAGLEQHSAVDYGVFGDPLLTAPGSAPSSGTLPGAPVATLHYFDIQATSPALNEGIDYSLLSITPGSNDFHGAAIPYNGTAYDAGAAELATASIAATETTDVAAITGDVTSATSASIAAVESADTASITGNANLGTTEGTIAAVETADTAAITAAATTSAEILAVETADAIVIMAVGDVVTATIDAADSADLAAISTAMPTSSVPPTTRILRPRRRRLGSDAYGVPPAG